MTLESVETLSKSFIIIINFIVKSIRIKPTSKKMITKLIIIFGQCLKCQLDNLFMVVTGPLSTPLIRNFCALKDSNNNYYEEKRKCSEWTF